MRKNFAEKVLRHWNRLPRDVVELPSLEVFQEYVEVSPGDMAWW